ncbi:heterokaryon incompatibility protein-domain-containing protein [Cladorrhinum sp. PSN259]|nr:heterokaryon incompatibility protein-domain-containing protein [Cladorrhinum sp. PSN259]
MSRAEPERHSPSLPPSRFISPCEHCKPYGLQGQLFILDPKSKSKCQVCQFLRDAIVYSQRSPDDDLWVPGSCSSGSPFICSLEEFQNRENGVEALYLSVDATDDNKKIRGGYARIRLIPVGHILGKRRITGRLIEEGTCDFVLFRKLITECCRSDSHEGCASLEGSIRHVTGFRVIDCETRHVITVDIASCRFVALSYVWGQGSQQPTPLSAKGELPHDVPRTINDAIKATQKLGLRYLWVDQYCIDQADIINKQQQISVMDVIYMSAWVTIISACGEDSSYGLPGISRPRVKQPQLSMKGTTWVPDYTSSYLRQEKWFTRGWTYQEGVFSRRRLIFTDQQVSFECNTVRENETSTFRNPSSPVRLVFDGGLTGQTRKNKKTLGLWAHIMKYSRRNLTMKEDILNALTGVFRAHSNLSYLPVYQFWGLPIPTALYCHLEISPEAGDEDKRTERDRTEKLTGNSCFSNRLDAAFACSLLWVGFTESEQKGERRQGFPSWSWAGWEGVMLSSRLMNDRGHELDHLGTAKFSAQREYNSGFDRLTESVLKSVNLYDGQPTLYTYTLKVDDAFVFDPVRIECHRRLSMMQKGYYIFSQNDLENEQDRQKVRPHCWEVDFLSQPLDWEMEDSISAASSTPSSGWFSCVFFSDSCQSSLSKRALILWNKPGQPSERVGHVEDACNRYTCSEYGVDLYPERLDGSLLNSLPFKKQTIFLS